MDKTIVTAMLVIVGVISAVFLFNAVFPVIGQSADAFTSMQGRVNERLKSQIEIIYAAKASSTSAYIWVKNVGDQRVAAVDACDLFFGPQGNFARIPYATSGASARWGYVVENGSEWNSTRTIKITVYNISTTSGNYYAKMVLPNGISDEYDFSW